MLLWLLLQAAAPDAPFTTLKGVVVDAIRNCMKKEDEIVVCSRDRGFAEGQRLPKIKKPELPPDAPTVTVKVTQGTAVQPTPNSLDHPK